MSKAGYIPNQVFVGLTWKNIRSKYEKVISKLHSSFPISFTIVGRNQNHDADDLLEIIKDKITSSSYAIFDATDGNANVSLEYGFAEALDLPRALYLSDRKRGISTAMQPIISDLAGKRRLHYKTEAKLKSLLEDFCKNHAYTKRFSNFIRSSTNRVRRGQKRSFRTLALKLIHVLDGKQDVRREELVQELLANNYTRDKIDSMISKLNKDGLIESPPGRYPSIKVK